MVNTFKKIIMRLLNLIFLVFLFSNLHAQIQVSDIVGEYDCVQKQVINGVTSYYSGRTISIVDLGNPYFLGDDGGHVIQTTIFELFPDSTFRDTSQGSIIMNCRYGKFNNGDSIYIYACNIPTWNYSEYRESEKIDLTDLPKGMYILEVQTAEKRFTEKVLKE